MDQTTFAEAQSAYDQGDFRTAAKAFLASAGRGSVGNGAAYHMAGNALMRLRRHGDAVTVYGHALRDDTYEKRGAVHANVGAAYVALGEYTEAVKAYDAALNEPDYPTPYKALQGMASALLERGRMEEAAGAYRRAALDEKNPDPGRALVNLGLCFMALGRPQDASDAYKAALGFEGYQGRGKALANLGQAYAALGRPEEAVRAFEKATQLHGHRLSPAAATAYEAAKAEVKPAHETVEGWVTGELNMIGGAELSAATPEFVQHPDGWGTGELTALTAAFETGSGPGGAAVTSETTVQPGAGFSERGATAAADLGFGDEHAVTEFFSRTEADMKVRDREARRAARGDRSSAPAMLRTALIAASITLVIAGGLGAAYWNGYGWPTQTSTVTRLLAAYSAGGAVETYWVGPAESEAVKREMAKIPPVREFTVDGVSRGQQASTVRATVTPEEGSALHYDFSLAREGVGWKVNGVDIDMGSNGE